MASAQGPITRGWKAWVEASPTQGRKLRVTGEVYVSHPRIEVRLTPLEPQGINARILLLELSLSDAPDDWPARPLWKAAQCNIDVTESDQPQNQIVVFLNDGIIADIGVVQ